ncbi:PQQ-binding-like beta-propeller repeat protein [Chitinophaga oryziterrae]|uniref:PQQ-binding-like beta-propeller repeat protein n=1 Tax=Chitinophaga oryziterrae TaxID=1031224 RepID=A0A6N8JDF5_9BACT|nr:PQQ-binding-like beta-propeller repeat protein [Chitinophaga oryziterrae]MVT43317.1 PQQ-binding-like beta-propeller repeat protein [Chitinophaga oryziterrae]
MFTPDNILKNIKSILRYGNNLIICSGDGGITVYNEDTPVVLSDISPDYACIINDHLLFQQANDSDIYCQPLDDLQTPVRIIEGRFFLSLYQTDNKLCYVPSKEYLFEFDEHFRPTNSYEIKRPPQGVRSGKLYQLYPHVSCFSMQIHTPIWELENDDQLVQRIYIRDKFFAIKNDLVILLAPFVDNANYLTALDADTSAIVWQYRDYIPEMNFIDGNIVVCYYLKKPTLEGRLLIIDSKTGSILTDLDLTSEFGTHSFRTGDYFLLDRQGAYLYMAATYDKSVHILNIETGRIEWSHKVDTMADWLTGITVTDKYLFVTDQLEMLHILKRS